MMNGYGKSDSSIVPEKLPNNARNRAAEVMEGRGLAKGNPLKRNVSRTQGRSDALSALERVRRALSIGALWRHHLRQEPDEVIPHVRICAGGAG